MRQRVSENKQGGGAAQPGAKVKEKEGCTVGLAEIGQNGPTSQKRSRSVVFLCKNEF